MGVKPFDSPKYVFFYSDSVCYSTMIAVSGWAAFILGYNILNGQKALATSITNLARYNINTIRFWSKLGEYILYLAIIVLIIIIVLAPSMFSLRYGEKEFEVYGGFTRYTIFMLTRLQLALIMIGSSLAVYGRIIKKKCFWPGWKIAVLIGLHSLIWALLGYRNAVIYPVSIIIVFISEKIKPLRLLHIIILIFISIIFLDIFGLARSFPDRNIKKTIELYLDLNERREHPFVIKAVEEQAGSVQTLFVARKAVPRYFAYGLGRHKISDILAFIPFGNKIVKSLGLDLSSENYLNSSYFLTYLIFNGDFTIGAGSTICADLYIDYGKVGIILGLFLVGFIMKKWQILSRCFCHIKHDTIYFLGVALLIQIPRRGITEMLYIVIWGIALIFIIKILFHRGFNYSGSVKY